MLRSCVIAACAVLLAVLVPPAAAAPVGARSVTAGSATSCALLVNGVVNCWGEDALVRRVDDVLGRSPVPVGVAGLDAVTSVDTGTYVSCAVIRGGTVRCWHHRGGYYGAYTDTPKPVPGLTDAVAVSVGSSNACVLRAGGSVACWGVEGSLGDGSSTASDTPVAVAGISSAVAVDSGEYYACAVLAGGTVSCWGRGAEGQLGDGMSLYSATPVTVSGITTAVAVSTGSYHACAALAGGGIACWGAGAYGELGDGASSYSRTPAAVAAIGNAVAVSAGGRHTCAVLAGGGVQCWGQGNNGELGTGALAGSATPVASGVHDAVGVSAGNGHTCAVRTNREVQCWGAGLSGQLGDGRSVSSATPVTVVGLGAPTPPVLEQSVTVEPVSGVVRVKPAGAASFTRLTAPRSLPLNSTVDATRGKVRLTSAVDPAGATQSGLFEDGEFQIGQGDDGLTDLTLSGPLPTGCGARAAAAAKPPKKKVRRLWGDAKGSFRSSGKHASATVQGTRWLVEDTCEGTLVRVARGVVEVEDLVTHRKVRVRAGGRYVARRGSRRLTSRGFVTGVERLLGRLADGRKRLSAALGGALDCSRSASAARQSVEAVIANRVGVRDDLNRLGAPSARAAKVRAHLKAAVKHSIAADRHYRDWLKGLGAACPPPSSAAFTAAGRDDARALAAKQRFVATFNPLAKRERLRTWRANEF